MCVCFQFFFFVLVMGTSWETSGYFCDFLGEGLQDRSGTIVCSTLKLFNLCFGVIWKVVVASFSKQFGCACLFWFMCLVVVFVVQ